MNLNIYLEHKIIKNNLLSDESILIYVYMKYLMDDKKTSNSESTILFVDVYSLYETFFGDSNKVSKHIINNFRIAMEELDSNNIIKIIDEFPNKIFKVEARELFIENGKSSPFFKTSFNELTSLRDIAYDSSLNIKSPPKLFRYFVCLLSIIETTKKETLPAISKLSNIARRTCILYNKILINNNIIKIEFGKFKVYNDTMSFTSNTYCRANKSNVECETTSDSIF